MGIPERTLSRSRVGRPESGKDPRGVWCGGLETSEGHSRRLRETLPGTPGAEVSGLAEKKGFAGRSLAPFSIRGKTDGPLNSFSSRRMLREDAV